MSNKLHRAEVDCRPRPVRLSRPDRRIHAAPTNGETHAFFSLSPCRQSAETAERRGRGEEGGGKKKKKKKRKIVSNESCRPTGLARCVSEVGITCRCYGQHWRPLQVAAEGEQRTLINLSHHTCFLACARSRFLLLNLSSSIAPPGEHLQPPPPLPFPSRSGVCWPSRLLISTSNTLLCAIGRVASPRVRSLHSHTLLVESGHRLKILPLRIVPTQLAYIHQIVGGKERKKEKKGKEEEYTEKNKQQGEGLIGQPNVVYVTARICGLCQVPDEGNTSQCEPFNPRAQCFSCLAPRLEEAATTWVAFAASNRNRSASKRGQLDLFPEAPNTRLVRALKVADQQRVRGHLFWTNTR